MLPDDTIRFDDGAAYETFMGRWSQLAGAQFLDWLAPPHGLRWLDVGCGNGAFTELLLDRCAPTQVDGIDPSDGQLAYARSRPHAGAARFHQGSATALAFADDSVDAAVMALVIFFVPDPARGVAEMARVVRAGGSVSAYAWDFASGGFPLAALQLEMRAMGIEPTLPPQVQAGAMDALTALWHGAGLVDVETTQINVERRFEDFESYWTVSLLGPTVASKLERMSPAERAQCKDRLRARVAPHTTGPVTIRARANAVKGRVPR